MRTINKTIIACTLVLCLNLGSPVSRLIPPFPLSREGEQTSASTLRALQEIEGHELVRAGLEEISVQPLAESGTLQRLSRLSQIQESHLPRWLTQQNLTETLYLEKLKQAKRLEVLIPRVSRLLKREEKSALLRETIAGTLAVPGIPPYFTQEGVAFLSVRNGNLVIIGDLHGDLKTLKKILQKRRYIPQKNQRAATPQYLAFVGDYGDVGEDSLGLIIKVLEMKVEDPEHVILLGGNHDRDMPSPWSAYVRSTRHPWFFAELNALLGRTKGAKLYTEWNALGFQLPSALATANGILVAHSAPPSSLTPGYDPEQGLLGIAGHPEIRDQMAWNYIRYPGEASGSNEDVIDTLFLRHNAALKKKWPGYGVGGETLRRFLRGTGGLIFVRGHHRAQRPKRVAFGGKFLTVISTDYRSPDHGYPRNKKIIARYAVFGLDAERQRIDPKKAVRYVWQANPAAGLEETNLGGVTQVYPTEADERIFADDQPIPVYASIQFQDLPTLLRDPEVVSRIQGSPTNAVDEWDEQLKGVVERIQPLFRARVVLELGEGNRMRVPLGRLRILNLYPDLTLRLSGMIPRGLSDGEHLFRLEISADGGRTWRQAEEPVQFRLKPPQTVVPLERVAPVRSQGVPSVHPFTLLEEGLGFRRISPWQGVASVRTDRVRTLDDLFEILPEGNGVVMVAQNPLTGESLWLEDAVQFYPSGPGVKDQTARRTLTVGLRKAIESAEEAGLSHEIRKLFSWGDRMTDVGADQLSGIIEGFHYDPEARILTLRIHSRVEGLPEEPIEFIFSAQPIVARHFPEPQSVTLRLQSVRTELSIQSVRDLTVQPVVGSGPPDVLAQKPGWRFYATVRLMNSPFAPSQDYLVRWMFSDYGDYVWREDLPDDLRQKILANVEESLQGKIELLIGGEGGRRTLIPLQVINIYPPDESGTQALRFRGAVSSEDLDLGDADSFRVSAKFSLDGGQSWRWSELEGSVEAKTGSREVVSEERATALRADDPIGPEAGLEEQVATWERSVQQKLQTLAEGRSENRVLVVPVRTLGEHALLGEFLARLPKALAESVVVWGEGPSADRLSKRNPALRYFEKEDPLDLAVFLGEWTDPLDQVTLLDYSVAAVSLRPLLAQFGVSVVSIPWNLRLAVQALGVPRAVSELVGLDALEEDLLRLWRA